MKLYNTIQYNSIVKKKFFFLHLAFIRNFSKPFLISFLYEVVCAIFYNFLRPCSSVSLTI